jgi:hypothetical protein
MLRAYESPRPALSYQELSASNLKAAAETSSVGGCRRFRFGGLFPLNFATTYLFFSATTCEFDHDAYFA